MEKNNINVENNTQQPETPSEATKKLTPKSYQKWFKLVEAECEKTRTWANQVATEHIEEINKLLFLYFKKGRTLRLRIEKSHIMVSMYISADKEIPLTALPIPHYDLLQYCPVAQREFFKVYIQTLNEEYGDFKAYENHTLGPEDYIEDVLPWAKIIPKSKTQKNDQKAKPIDPDSDDDIRLIFSRRDQA